MAIRFKNWEGDEILAIFKTLLCIKHVFLRAHYIRNCILVTPYTTKRHFQALLNKKKHFQDPLNKKWHFKTSLQDKTTFSRTLKQAFSRTQHTTKWHFETRIRHFFPFSPPIQNGQNFNHQYKNGQYLTLHTKNG